MADTPGVKEVLIGKGMQEKDVERFLSYVSAERRAEANKDANKRPVTGNTADELADIALKFYGLGLVVDGINVVVTGKRMAMVTYHGYKNKVLQVYPESAFDIQLVREGDTFNVAKESGAVEYSHQINDPFGNKAIVGAYCVIKNKRGEYLELLNSHDYEEMKSASKQSFLWNKWPSEFWLKSVIKRACKRHFNDITAEIDKVDNEDYGLQEDGEAHVLEDEEISGSIAKAKDRQALYAIMAKLTPEQKRSAASLVTVRMKELANVKVS